MAMAPAPTRTEAAPSVVSVVVVVGQVVVAVVVVVVVVVVAATSKLVAEESLENCAEQLDPAQTAYGTSSHLVAEAVAASYEAQSPVAVGAKV